jgi:uracil-DNA glycosylase
MIDAASITAIATAEGCASEGSTVSESEAWALHNVHTSWLPLLNDVLGTPEGIALEKFVSESRKNEVVYPKKNDVFAALCMDISKVSVVILGQDPYHGPDQAMGLAFSVPDNVSAPPSLKNIMKEITSDLGVTCDKANLSSWTEQGVLLLNTLLTVEAGKPLSHAQKGWETVTDRILKELSDKYSGIVFLLWGNTAQKKSVLINSSQKHTILEAAHPSPLSAYKGFFGCKHFTKTNDILGPEKAIRWII